MSGDHEFCLGTPLGLERMLARSLMEYWGLDWTQYPNAVAGLSDAIGDEVLSFSREFLEEAGLLKVEVKP